MPGGRSVRVQLRMGTMSHCVQFSSVQFSSDYITNGHGYPMQTTGCTWPCVVPVGEDPAAHGHWCAFTDLCHAMPHHTSAGRFGGQASVTDIYHAMPWVCHRRPCHPTRTMLTDMVSRCRLLAAHGLRSCPSVRTQPLTATGAPSRTSAMPCHAMPCTLVRLHRPLPCHVLPSTPSQTSAMPCHAHATSGYAWLTQWCPSPHEGVGGGYAQGAHPCTFPHL